MEQHWAAARATMARLSREAGQGTVEYVGLILLMGVLIAGVVKASSGFNDTTVADAVVKKLKTAIESVESGK
ncbi:MAG: hypothetical protein H0U80_00365 [Solirubrobacterales bacterium]|nr:hypothetical protein [Solirubrobacterales bacterium]